MTSLDQARIGIVGLGAIGGSLALALRGRSPVVAWSRDPTDRAAAQAAGVDVCGGEGDVWIADFANTAVIVLAVPLDEIGALVRQISTRVPDDTLVLHTGSLQRREALGLTDAEFGRVLGTHPMAGSEHSGFSAARDEMFRGATVRAEARATTIDRHRIASLWRDAGVANIAWGEATDHDELMSWVSHLPQLASTALGALLADRGIGPEHTGPGARDTTRLASSDLGMWRPILHNAPDHTLSALRRLTSTLGALGDALESGDSALVETLWNRARSWRMKVEQSG